ncbi:MAG: TIGR01906 family membrane protein [Limosilactobacillus gorillae]|jgi:integral membrane protein (TIGR01906 family)|uniref:TIGR01906 family membrane protein n=1 Tax=Limosilactobacillus gorillae TaxID=1450649 RepID=UPI000B840247|nr:TIGR01906 family membrane protein [Limosilactobacillus gorillae]MDO4856036.1 TIGR01906 family membrane protein [Limosilactobacillus gorillae]
MNGWWDSLIDQGRAYLITLVMVLACLGGALFVVTNASYWLVDGRLMGVSQHLVDHDYLRILGYLQLPGIKGAMTLDYLPTDGKVIRHFRDVRNLFLMAEGLTLFAVVGSWWGLWWSKKHYQLWRLLSTLRRAMILILLGLLTIGLNFEPAFLWFHQHFFSNMDWLFDPKKEPLINLWPASFFMTLAIGWGALVEGFLGILYWRIKMILRRFVFTETGLKEADNGRNQRHNNDGQDD